jgi:hypothetical protein
LAAEEREHGDDAAGAEHEAQEREDGLAPVSPRLVEAREQRLDEIQTTRPSLM